MEIDNFDILLVLALVVVVLMALYFKATSDGLVLLVVGGFLALLKGISFTKTDTSTDTTNTNDAGSTDPTLENQPSD
jgi:hypothetical protein